MAKLETVKLHNGQKINVPADIRQMSNFVLKEQGKWFEDEVEFVQQLVEPNMNCLDIGANFGIYSCTIASQLTKDKNSCGKLWSYEPTPDTAEALRLTLNENNLNDSASVQQLGLSNKEGNASFYINDNPELYSLHRESDGGQQVTIELSTLDIESERLNLPQIDFIKLDAEGEESKILSGGQRFFEENSPIVMFELHHAGQINETLINDFEKLEFDLFKLVPSLSLLRPFDKNQVTQLDLNLFAIRKPQQKELIERNLLVTTSQSGATQFNLASIDNEKLFNVSEQSLSSCSTDYLSILKCYCYAHSEGHSKASKLEALSLAADMANAYRAKTAKPEELLSIAQILSEAGNRFEENRIYAQLINSFSSGNNGFEVTSAYIQPSLNVTAASSNHGKTIAAWTMELWIRRHAWSCYFGELQTVVQLIQYLNRIEMKSAYVINLENLLIKLHQASNPY